MQLLTNSRRTSYNDCPWLFYWVDEQGKYRQLITIRRSWQSCLKKAGLSDLRIHDLRHISATDLYEAGNPEREIMDIAGWRSPMLSHYRHEAFHCCRDYYL